MTNEEAKFMLSGYRSNGADAKNETFAEALAQAERDPLLRNWFEREQEFDAIIAPKMGQVSAPSGLRESILAGTKLSLIEKTTRKVRVWWANPWSIMLGAAAAFALVFTTVYRTANHQVAQLPGFEPVLKIAMADFSGTHSKGTHAHELGEFGQWITNGSSKLGADIMPVNLAELRELGCRTIDVAGHEIFEICFQRESGWYHVYIAPRDVFSDQGVYREPMFHESGEFIAASWADSEFAYLVSTSTGRASLRGLL